MKKKKKNLLLTLIQLILIAIILFSLYRIGTYLYQNWSNTQITNKVVDIVEQVEREDFGSTQNNESEDVAEDIDLDELSKRIIERLKTENEDIVSYIKFEEVKINNPVVYRKEDNDFYLYKDLNKNYSAPGTLFLNGWNKPDYTDMNTTIFGHNMRVWDGFMAPMFKLLLNFEDAEFVNAQDSYFVEIYTEHGYKKYEVFSAYYSNRYNDYIQANRPVEEWVDYLNSIKEESINEFDFNHEFVETDQILTLSTCDEVRGNDEGRFVVHALLVEG